MTGIEILNPKEMGPVLGPYSQIARVRASEFVIIAGQVGADANGKLAAGFEAQCEQMYSNIETALKAVGGGWSNVVSFTSYLVNSDDIPKYMSYRAKAYPSFFPSKVYPPHTLAVVAQLVQKPLLVEVATMAALP
jgi:enamine deaminase RidA (YjgF/YER057c/UK114 family)